MRWLIIPTMLLVLAARLLAQLPAPNAAGVSAGHMHMMVRDPEAHKKVWVEALGAQVVNSGSLELLKLPGIFLVLGKAETAEGSEGSSVDHFAFRAKDLPATKAKLAAAGVPIVREDPREIVAMFPDKVKVEFYAAPTLGVPLEHYTFTCSRTIRTGYGPGTSNTSAPPPPLRGMRRSPTCPASTSVFAERTSRRPPRKAALSITSVSR